MIYNQTPSTFKSLIDRVSYPGFEMEFHKDGDRAQVRVTCPDGTCNETGKPMSWNGRWWRLSYYMTDSEVVATCFKAVITAVEHETREKFRFEGISVYDSHIDVHELKRIKEEGKIDVR